MTHAKAVAWFLDRARNGDDDDDAFHGLRELPDEALLAMEAGDRAERDPDLRSLIIAAVREHPSAVRLDFLAEALENPSPVVWKRTLDALVVQASRRAAEILERAIQATSDRARRDWLEEAHGQIVDSIDHRS